MKIQLQNILFSPWGSGIGNYLYYVSKTLLKLNHEPSVLCGRHRKNLAGDEVYEGIKIVRYPDYAPAKLLYSARLSFLSVFTYQRKLTDFIRRRSRDADAIWARHPYCAYACAKAFPDKPLIYIQAGAWPKALKRLNSIAPGSWRRKISFKLHSFQNYYIEKKAIAMSNKVVALSTIMKKEISEFYRLPPDKIISIPPGVDLERFKAREKDSSALAELSIPEGSKIILSVCRLSPEKNIVMLLRAFARIDTYGIYLVIVGEGQEKEHLKSLSRELKIGGKVIFTGHRRDPEKFYNIADIFVLPSVYEGFGHVYLEAMASGLPCVGLRSDYPRVVVATEEIIRDGETGYLADPDQVEDLSGKIKRIIFDNELRVKMGEAARKACEQKYSWEEHVKKILRLTG